MVHALAFEFQTVSTVSKITAHTETSINYLLDKTLVHDIVLSFPNVPVLCMFITYFQDNKLIGVAGGHAEQDTCGGTCSEK